MQTRIGIGTVLCLLFCFGLTLATAQDVAERVAAGRKLLDGGKIEAAISEFEKAVAMEPRYAAAHLNLGAAYERANRTNEAIEAYRKSIDAEPRNFYAHNNLGVLYDKQGKYDDAITEFQYALKNEPNSTMALKNLETARKNKVVVQERNALISRAAKEIEASPKEPRRAYDLARLHASYGNTDKAIEWLTKAIQLGYKDITNIKTDPAFAAIRNERDFELLLLKHDSSP